MSKHLDDLGLALSQRKSNALPKPVKKHKKLLITPNVATEKIDINTYQLLPISKDKVATNTVYVKLEELTVHSHNVRDQSGHNQAALDDLIRKIDAQGQLEPILIQKNKQATGYEIVDGSSRFAALKILQSRNPDDIKFSGHCVIANLLQKRIDDEEIALISAMKNEVKPLSNYEKAVFYKNIMTQNKLTAKQVFDVYGLEYNKWKHLIELEKIEKRYLQLFISLHDIPATAYRLFNQIDKLYAQATKAQQKAFNQRLNELVTQTQAYILKAGDAPYNNNSVKGHDSVSSRMIAPLLDIVKTKQKTKVSKNRAKVVHKIKTKSGEEIVFSQTRNRKKELVISFEYTDSENIEDTYASVIDKIASSLKNI